MRYFRDNIWGKIRKPFLCRLGIHNQFHYVNENDKTWYCANCSEAWVRYSNLDGSYTSWYANDPACGLRLTIQQMPPGPCVVEMSNKPYNERYFNGKVTLLGEVIVDGKVISEKDISSIWRDSKRENEIPNYVKLFEKLTGEEF